MEIDKLINHIFTIIDTNDYSTVKKKTSTLQQQELNGKVKSNCKSKQLLMVVQFLFTV